MIASYLYVFILMLFGVFSNLIQGTVSTNSSESVSEKKNIIYIVGHDWHTGVVIHREDIPDSLKLKHPKFLQSKFVEIGWGDKEFYQNSGPDVDYWLAVRAALWPTESVLHVNGFNQSVEDYYYVSKIIQFEIEARDFDNLCHFIHSAFKRDSIGVEIWIGKGHYRNSHFFLGEDSYYFPKTCNVWTAQAVHAAGISISPFRFQQAETLMEYLSKFELENKEN